MKYNYKPKTNLEKFGDKVYNSLVENFPQTFYVGGMVRDLLLHRPITDIDIATSATPDAVADQLNSNGIKYGDRHKKFGVITAASGPHKIEITTFRKDLAAASRYPDVTFISNPKADSLRRDFTVNALYLSQKTGEILDFHNGTKDIEHRLLRFIGNPAKRIKEDPLRIVRAIRFAVTLNLKIEHWTDRALEKHFSQIKNVTRSRVYAEINKIKNPVYKKVAETILSHKKLLDNYA